MLFMTISTPGLSTTAQNQKLLANARRLVEQALALLDRGSFDLSLAAQLQDTLDRIISAGAAAELRPAA
jgi:hypothetical protein